MLLTVLDPEFKQIKKLDVYDSLIWTDRYRGYGDYEITTYAWSKIVGFLSIGNYLHLKGSEHTMMIESAWIHSTSEAGDKIINKGRSLEAILDRRIVWNQTILTGSFQNAIQLLLSQNAINPVDDNRLIPNLVFQASNDPAVTELTVDAQFFGENLYEAIDDLCKSVDLGFKITADETTGFWIFKLYAGVDRSYNQFENPYVVFSPKNMNVVDSDYKESITKLKTVCLVAGEGEGNERDKVVVSDSEGTQLSRREVFSDAKNVSRNTPEGTLTDEEYFAQLAQKGFEELADRKFSITFEGQIDPSKNYIYGKDFSMGDIVQVANAYGYKSRSRVTELIHAQDSSGNKLYPTFSTMA